MVEWLHVCLKSKTFDAWIPLKSLLFLFGIIQYLSNYLYTNITEKKINQNYQNFWKKYRKSKLRGVIFYEQVSYIWNKMKVIKNHMQQLIFWQQVTHFSSFMLTPGPQSILWERNILQVLWVVLRNTLLPISFF